MAELPQELLARAAAGDQESFERLFAPVAESAYYLALGLLQDREAAERAVIRSAVAAFKRLRRQQPQSSLRFWFASIVRAECKDMGMRSSREDRQAILDTNELNLQNLRSLSFQERSILVLRYYLGLAVEEVATLERLSADTVINRLGEVTEQLGPLFADGEGWYRHDELVMARRLQALIHLMGAPDPALRERIHAALGRRARLEPALLRPALVMAGVIGVLAAIPLLLLNLQWGRGMVGSLVLLATASFSASGGSTPNWVPYSPSATHPATSPTGFPPATAAPTAASTAAATATAQPTTKPTSTQTPVAAPPPPPPPAPGALLLSDNPPPGGEVGLLFGPVSYSASAGSPPYTWSVPAAPSWLSTSSDATSLRLQGTPTSAGAGSLTVTVNDARGASQSRSYTLTVSASLALADSPLPHAEVGVGFSASYSSSGGAGPFAWSVSPSVPGLQVIPQGGAMTLSGTPSAAGPQTVSIRVADSLGASQSRTYSLSVAPQLALGSLPASIPHAQAYSATLAGGGVPGYSVQVSGTLPPGLTVSGSGLLSGTPPAAGGPYNFTISISDSCPSCTGSASRSYTLNVS